MVLEGTIEYHIGDPVEHTITLNKWDTLSCPPRVYRGFRNVGDIDAVQLTVVTGMDEGNDDVSVPDSVAQDLEKRFGADVADAIRGVAQFDPPNQASD